VFTLAATASLQGRLLESISNTGLRRLLNKGEWMDRSLLRAFKKEGTDAHRLCTIEDGWVERFGRDILISYKTIAARDHLVLELYLWGKSVDFPVGRVFSRRLPRKNEERDAPTLMFGNENENLKTTATELFLKFGIDFNAGYSVGLFVDQRENRRYVREMEPKRLLNCFAYTCSFSVVAAAGGAQTVNIDLSKKYLARGRENFALNALPTTEHRFIADDVRPVLRRLARRGEKFDMIILDPPTFSRSPVGKIFRIDGDFEKVLLAALEIAARDARILLSTNSATLHEHCLEVMARYCLKMARRAGTLDRQQAPADFARGTAASTIWLSLR
jgi:23S rRNA (cytosine1962-C5)-methyltransferase